MSAICKKKLEHILAFKTIISTMHGRHYTKAPDFGAANFVMDFQMDTVEMDNANILIQKGPNLDKLTKHEKEHIASVIMDIWTETALRNRHCVDPNTIRKALCFGCCCFMVILVAMVAVLESNLYLIRSERMKQIVAIALGLCSVIILSLIFCGMLFVMKQRYFVDIDGIETLHFLSFDPFPDLNHSDSP